MCSILVTGIQRVLFLTWEWWGTVEQYCSEREYLPLGLGPWCSFCRSAMTQEVITVTTLLISSVTLFLWMVLQIYASSSSSSSPSRLTQLTNSLGKVCGENKLVSVKAPTPTQVCGEGENEGRENLLYFDISKCAGLEARYEHCKSIKVRQDNNFNFTAEQYAYYATLRTNM